MFSEDPVLGMKVEGIANWALTWQLGAKLVLATDAIEGVSR